MKPFVTPYPTLKTFAERAKGMNRRVAVAAAHDEDTLKAVVLAAGDSICSASLFGKADKIRALLTELGADERAFTIVEPEDASGEACARAAIAAVVNGEADFLMKGALNTTELLKQVVRSPLMTGAPLSHAMFFEPARYGKLLLVTDGGMNPAPDLERKKAILINAANLLIMIGYERIYAACVSGSEVVSEKIPSTVDARAIAEMDWSSWGMRVYGPVGVDLAISAESRAHKGYAADVENADILLMPNYETANCFGKALTYFADTPSAGLVVGASRPIVLVSRADPAETKCTSLALGAIAAKGE